MAIKLETNRIVYNGRVHEVRLPVYDGKLFEWGARKGTGYTDASTLGIKPGDMHNIHGRVWYDACDMGFIVRSHKTGALKLFVLLDTVTLGELTYVSDDFIFIKVYND